MSVLTQEEQNRNPELDAQVVLISASYLLEEINSIKTDLTIERKKLEELKAENEGELASIRQKISLLETRLTTLQDQVEEFKRRADTSINNISSKIPSLVTLSTITLSQGVWKSKTCRHNGGGVCGAWNISDPERTGVPKEAVVPGQQGNKISVSKFPELCVACPLYESIRVTS